MEVAHYEQLPFFNDMKRFLPIIFIAFCFLSSCKKDDSSVVNIIVTQPESIKCINDNETINFKIHAFSEKKEVNKLTISSYDGEKGNITVLDSLINSDDVTFYYSYHPQTYTQKDTTSVKLTFTAFSSDNKSTSMVYYLKVVRCSSTLESHDGIIMYAKYSHKQNGFNISSCETLVCETTTDTTLIDIYDYLNEQLEEGVLSREWRSMSDVLFARFNDFDYPNATQLTLNNAYQASSKFSSINNISIGDIILVGRENTSFGVIQITGVYDEDDPNNDRYHFNIKKHPGK